MHIRPTDAPFPEALAPTLQPGNIVSLDDATAADRAVIYVLMDQIKLADTPSIITFGSTSQTVLQRTLLQIAKAVCRADTHHMDRSLHDTLNTMVAELSAFEVFDLSRQAQSWRRFFTLNTPAKQAHDRFKTTRRRLITLQIELSDCRDSLLQDLGQLDQHYRAAIKCFDQVGLHIAAGTEIRRRATVEDLPVSQKALRQKALRQLDHRIWTLEEAHRVSFNALPSVAELQDVRKNLDQQIDTIVMEAIPHWADQISHALTPTKTLFDPAAIDRATNGLIEVIEQSLQTLRQAGDLSTDAQKSLNVHETPAQDSFSTTFRDGS